MRRKHHSDAERRKPKHTATPSPSRCAAKRGLGGDRGYKYKDEAASIAGISLILLKASDTAGGSKIIVKGKHGNLDLSASTLPFAATDVVVQLSNSLYTDCWVETFPTGSVKKNADERFNAKTP